MNSRRRRAGPANVAAAREVELRAEQWHAGQGVQVLRPPRHGLPAGGLTRRG